jgi:hypothetical protein
MRLGIESWDVDRREKQVRLHIYCRRTPALIQLRYGEFHVCGSANNFPVPVPEAMPEVRVKPSVHRRESSAEL